MSGDPTQPLQAADKHYVDTQVATAVPLAGGNMTGALTTPAVNGVQAPAAGSAQTTLQAAMTAAGTNGAMEIPPTYAGTDTFTNPNGVRVTDLRTGVAQQTERSVKEFGAVCDGATDDTNALQAALNYAQRARSGADDSAGNVQDAGAELAWGVDWRNGQAGVGADGISGAGCAGERAGRDEHAELHAAARFDDLCGSERGCVVLAGGGARGGGKLRR